jgi:pimeloyl-ACP methyl ester carboxylesterase
MSSRQTNHSPRRRSSTEAPDARRHRLADWTGGVPVFVPQGYEAGYDYPLLVWLSDPLGPPVDLGRCMARVSLRNFVAVEAAGGATAVWQAVDRVTNRLSIHPRRIWLVGREAAGTEAFRIACRHPESFAGVVSLGGAFPLDESLFARIDAVRRLPMLYCCTAADAAGAAGHTDRMLRLFHAAGATLAMRIYPRRRDLGAAALADVNRWLMDEICGSAAAARAAVAG